MANYSEQPTQNCLHIHVASSQYPQYDLIRLYWTALADFSDSDYATRSNNMVMQDSTLNWFLCRQLPSLNDVLGITTKAITNHIREANLNSAHA